MYKIFADDTLIYDSTLEDYRIGKGSITLETNKSGSFTFSLYPDHFYYDNFVRLKTVITVFKSGKIVFRGRILNDVTDYWNNKVLTCEGELGFLQDSIIRPFSFSGTPEALFRKFIEEHNSQVDEFKRFKIGRVTIADSNNYIARSNSSYESALSNLNSRLIEDSLGGYFYITHGEDGDERTPTINYIADFTKVATQVVEFGSNLKNYTKTVKGEDIATAIIPLGKAVDDGDSETEDPKLTIKDVNNGLDYVYSQEGVALYGWIFKVVSWDDVTDANNLKNKAKAYVEESVKQNITIELNAIDLHLLDKSIESFCVGDYIRVVSTPHNFDSTLLCNKQTIDLLKPENDSLVLGYTYAAFSERQNKISSSISVISGISSKVDKVSNSVTSLNQTVTENEQVIYNDIEAIASAVTENARNIASNTEAIQENTNNISANAENIAANTEDIESNASALQTYKNAIKDYVVEQGISGSWTYRKWNSGICEAWRYISSLSLGGTTTVNGFSFGYAVISLPSIFTSITTVNYSFYGTSGYDFGGKVVISGTSSFNIYIGSASTLSGNIRLYPYVIGKWK